MTRCRMKPMVMNILPFFICKCVILNPRWFFSILDIGNFDIFSFAIMKNSIYSNFAKEAFREKNLPDVILRHSKFNYYIISIRKMEL